MTIRDGIVAECTRFILYSKEEKPLNPLIDMPSIHLKLTQKDKTLSLVEAGAHQVHIDRPLAKGGSNQGPMGGQVLLMGIAGCFASTLYGAAIARDMTISNLGIEVEAEISPESPVRFTSIILHIIAGSCSEPDQFEKLLAIAEKGCIAVNTVKNGMNFGYRVGVNENAG